MKSRVSLAVLAALVLSVGGALPAAAADAAGPVGPGARMLTDTGDGRYNVCTAAFGFTTDDGAQYLGYAAHCASSRADDDMTGCDAVPLPLGSPVSIESPRGRAGGTVAYSSWTTMQRLGEQDPAACQYNDFALVRVAGAVDPTVPEIGGPTAVATDTRAGERVSSYQPNNGGQAVRTGTSQGPVSGGWGHEMTTRPPGDHGDSGSGYLDSSRAAFGILSTRLTGARGTNGVTDLAAALAYAQRHGGLGPIRLLPGRA